MTTEAQLLAGYGCSCGERLQTIREFRSHQLVKNRGAEKGQHLSIGRIDMQTGDVIMPPVAQRTTEQRNQSKYAVKKKPTDGTGGTRTGAIPTGNTSEALELRVTPRFANIDYSPIMRMAQDASIRIWGWPEMPLGDFIDTIFYKYFKRCGVSLQGYMVDETEEEQLEREEAIKQFKEVKADDSPS